MIQNRWRKSGVFLLATVLIALLFPVTTPVAQAQDAGSAGLSISPPIFESDANPGQTVTQKFRIDNLSPDAKNLTVDVQNFVTPGEEGQALPTTESNPFSIASWTTVTPQKAVLPPGPGSSVEFTATIKVPQNPGPGGHFGALVFNAEPGDSNAQVKVKSSVGGLVLLRTPGTATEKISIASFTATDNKEQPKDKGFFNGGPVGFSLRLKNEGNVQVRPEASIEIRNIFGSKIATLPVESQRVLPDSTRRLSTTWKHNQLFGLYTAKATVKYGSTGEVVTSTTKFWGAPVLALGIGIGVIVALFLLVWLPRKRIKKALRALTAAD